MNQRDLSGRKYFELSHEQKVDWLRLIRSQNVGPVTFRDLISHFGSAKDALEAIPELAKRGGAAARINVCPRDRAEKELEDAQRANAQMICMGEPAYPPLLRQLDSNPPVLFIKGKPERIDERTVAIVGSRNASIAGKKVARQLGSELAQKQFLVCSGLARGIDTQAHIGSLEKGTVAVFAGGVNVVFTDENQKLAEEIIGNGGALVSEMPMGWRPRAQDFPRRNRIITGLSLAVIVVEAAKRSGSLITARMATEAGRLVLAVPGSPLDPRSVGANRLIRDGATLITSADDVAEAVSPLLENPVFQNGLSETPEPTTQLIHDDLPEVPQTVREQIVQSLDTAPVSVDDILAFASASPGAVQLALLELDLAGQIERHPGGFISRIV